MHTQSIHLYCFHRKIIFSLPLLKLYNTPRLVPALEWSLLGAAAKLSGTDGAPFLISSVGGFRAHESTEAEGFAAGCVFEACLADSSP